MKAVTFYSFKGGVGRSLALINVGHALARMGLRVLWLDMDIEAPGLGRTPETGGPDGWRHAGASDLLLTWLGGATATVGEHVVEVENKGSGWLGLMPAGTKPAELARCIHDLFAEPDAPHAYVFDDLLDQIESQLAPDVLLIDSRTGLADVSAVCTVGMADAVVVFVGLNEQGLAGTQDVLKRIAHHPFRRLPPIIFPVFSPVPSRTWMGVPDGVGFRELFGAVDPLSLPGLVGNRAWASMERRMADARSRLGPPSVEAFLATRHLYPYLQRADLVHVLEHDPEVPLLGELHLDRLSLQDGVTRLPLVAQYERLARALACGLLAQPRPPADAYDRVPWFHDLEQGRTGDRVSDE